MVKIFSLRIHDLEKRIRQQKNNKDQTVPKVIDLFKKSKKLTYFLEIKLTYKNLGK